MGRPIIDSGVMPVTVVYVDRVLLLNLAVDYLLLMTTATLAGTPLRRLRFGICAAFGGGYAVGVFLLPLLAHPLCRVGVGSAMALWAFWREVRPWRMTALFWLLSGGLAGLLLALGLLAGSPMGVLQRVYYADISWPVLLGAAAGFYGLLHLLFRQSARHEGGELMDIDVVIDGKQCRLRALRDNGNTLRDPVRGQPVLVAETAALQTLWSPEAADILSTAAPPEEKMARLHAAGVTTPFVLLPFRAVGTADGLLLACRSDYIRIGRRTVAHTLVALTETAVGAAGSQALWGGQEKEGRHDVVAAHCTVDPTAGQAG